MGEYRCRCVRIPRLLYVGVPGSRQFMYYDADVTLCPLHDPEEIAARESESAHDRQQERDLLGDTGPTNTERQIREAGRG